MGKFGGTKVWLALALACVGTSGIAEAREACFGIDCCEAGSAAVSYARERGLGCAPVAASERGQECFVDHATPREGMHACPKGSYLRGLSSSENLLVCCYHSARGWSDLDGSRATTPAAGCAEGSVLTGISVDGNQARCSRLEPARGGASARRALERSRSFAASGQPLGDWAQSTRRWLHRILDLPAQDPPFPAMTDGSRVATLSEEQLASGVVRRKVRYFSPIDGTPVFAYLLFPPGYSPQGSYPAVFFAHGHSDDGKHGSAVDRANIHHAGALALAESGAIALAPDTRGFGEMTRPGMDHLEYTEHVYRETRNYGRYAQYILGEALYGVSVLLGQRGVDRARVYSAGLSLGAYQALWVAALDERIRGGAIVGGLFVSFKCLNNPDHPRYAHPCQNIPALSLDHARPMNDLLLEIEDLSAMIAMRPGARILSAWGASDPFYVKEPFKACAQSAARETRQLLGRLGLGASFSETFKPGMKHEFDVEAAREFVFGGAKPARRR